MAEMAALALVIKVFLKGCAIFGGTIIAVLIALCLKRSRIYSFIKGFGFGLFLLSL